MLSAVGKLVKYSVAIGASGTLIGTLHANEWQVSNLGITRFGRAAFTVASIAADYKLSLRNLSDETEGSKSAWSVVHTRSAEKLLKLCSINGGVFIKVGQHIGSLDYLVPPEYCQVLRVLHDRAPESSIESIKKVIAKDLGKSADELFEEFDEKPLGTASLAQVYKAKLRDGKIVAVKVQHPDVRSHSLVDMTSMEMLVRLVAKIFPEFSFLWLADEMKINLPLELDFIHEGRNCERVGRLFSHLKWLKVPSILWQYSSQRVLTMEYLVGGKVTDKEYMKSKGLNTRMVSHRLGLLYSEMIFMQGYVHCDPHPGNILVSNVNGDPQIILLDHGLYTTLSEKFRHQYSQLWHSLIKSDLEGIKKWGSELGAGDLFPLLACILAGKTWDTISSGLTKSRPKAQSEAEDAELKNYARQYFPQIAAILNRVPREMLLLFKTNDLLRSIEYSLGTRGERTSLLTMSKCCIRSIYDNKLRECRNILSSSIVRLQKNWQLTKISLYQFYLWFSCLLITN
ncbi:aarF domain-containing protein kinase 1-like [Panonychus citri]|uniref:aarF domain-containing protein kinase 1-like n=1 Tax=Panonychus citri TaxID=50023 RepID=UPI002307C53A|nr:aarF domain-containing protein kinase 1-like [Panonychus citri]XP_053201563.1 aarF domain-containing protein kinase 1-like [Panonychus citri]